MKFQNFLPVLALLATMTASGAAEEWKPLYDRIDPEFQTALETRLNENAQWRKLIKNRKMAICVVDMGSEPVRFARVNGNQMMYAASLPKIAILVAAYVSFEDGSLVETDAINKDLNDMIRVSSNSAATRMIERITMKKIQAVMRDPQYGFYDESRGGGLWVGKRYASSGPRVGDPMHNISHGATATQVCRVFYQLANGKLINQERSNQMLEKLVDPRLHHKFVSQIDERAPKAKLFRKSGTWRQWHSDAIMVQGIRWRNYILVGLVESEDGEAILRNVLPAIEDLLVPSEYAEGGYDIPGSDPLP